MTLAEFHALDEDAAAAVLGRCCAAPRWVEGMLAARPFPTAAALAAAAKTGFAQLDEEDWLAAFAAHPMIGDLDSLREKYAASRDLSGREQGGVEGADEATLAELARLNADYLERFGFLFIVFASGRSAAQMLALLRARINNTREEELANAAAEQGRITLRRLDELVVGTSPTAHE